MMTLFRASRYALGLGISLSTLFWSGCALLPDRRLTPAPPEPTTTTAPPTPTATPSTTATPAVTPTPTATDLPHLAATSPSPAPSPSQPDLSAPALSGTAALPNLGDFPTDPTERLIDNGFADPAAVQEFVATLQTAAIQGDRATLVTLIRFPLTIYDNGVPVTTYETAADLLPVVEQVISPGVLAALRSATYADLFVNAEGAMIGNGEVWFDQREDGLKIRAINAPEAN